MDSDIEAYVQRLVSAYPEITLIWLIGSRANNKAREDSDWDFFVFANQQVLADLGNNLEFHRSDIDLLVIYNGDDFQEPWGEKPKHGSLTEWKWRKVSTGFAQYKGTKGKDGWVFGDDTVTETRIENAIKVWPKE